MDTARRILVELAVDPYLRGAYAADPERALAGLGIASETAQAALRHIHAAPAESERWAACRTCSDPGPDPFPEDATPDAPRT